MSKWQADCEWVSMVNLGKKKPNIQHRNFFIPDLMS